MSNLNRNCCPLNLIKEDEIRWLFLHMSTYLVGGARFGWADIRRRKASAKNARRYSSIDVEGTKAKIDPGRLDNIDVFSSTNLYASSFVCQVSRVADKNTVGHCLSASDWRSERNGLEEAPTALFIRR